MNKNRISMKIKFDQELTPCEADSERVLEVVIQADEVEESFQRPPLNLAMVIDRSGSMEGDKLENVKKAASHVIRLLADKDRMALVDYGSDVRVRSNSVLVDNETRPALLDAINSIRITGCTNLSGGWLTGCQEIAGEKGNGYFTHTLLLTDGLANEGIVNSDELAVHARELARRGITTSTFGVGSDFDQQLLEAMANHGQGLFRFIESPMDIPAIFKGVFKELLNIVAHEIEITLEYPHTLKATVLGNYSTEYPEAGKLRISDNPLSAGKSKDVFIKFSIPPGQENTDLPFKVSLRAKDEKEKLIEIVSEGHIKMTARETAEAAQKDDALMERFAQVDLADKASEALKLEKEGKRQEASDLVNSSLQMHSGRLRPQTHARYQSMSGRMAAGMDELDRKRSHYDSYNLKKAMLMRQSYRLVPQTKRHIIFDLDGQLVILDTGSPASFGNIKNWEFMGRKLHLKDNFMGVTVDFLSKYIGVPIEVLLGMDVLKDLYFQIDLQQNEIHFYEYPLPGGRRQVHFETYQGIPYASLMMNGKLIKVFIDTGAKIHYLTQTALSGLEVVDRETDFYPYLGEFETDVYELPFEIAGEKHTMRCGVLPPLLEKSLAVTGVEGILGTEIFDKYNVTFDFPNKCLWLDRYPD